MSRRNNSTESSKFVRHLVFSICFVTVPYIYSTAGFFPPSEGTSEGNQFRKIEKIMEKWSGIGYLICVEATFSPLENTEPFQKFLGSGYARTTRGKILDFMP